MVLFSGMMLVIIFKGDFIMLKKRGVFVSILLTIITCGIYAYFWIGSLSNDISDCLGEQRNGAMDGFLSFITCGLYLFYWNYKNGKKIADIQDRVGIRPADNSVLYLLICFIGLSLVPVWIMQSNINEIIDRM